ncbi:hypothetical protein BC833DRAFT_652835 [Globomyces pollinis-pini]|nr:hypothetical protein BC833DRAFT_652835 [Globomyces pollinis-pini]
MKITKKAYIKMIFHGIKYSTHPISGILIGKNKQIITDVIPLTHSLLLPSPITHVALTQIDLYCKENGLLMLGLYFGNENNLDLEIHAAIDLIAGQLNKHLDGGAVLLKLDPTSFKSDSSGLLMYSLSNSVWLESSKPLEIDWTDIKPELKKWIENQSYKYLYDFDCHLADIQLDWIRNELLDDYIK